MLKVKLNIIGRAKPIIVNLDYLILALSDMFDNLDYDRTEVGGDIGSIAASVGRHFEYIAYPINERE